jgi:YegS/Rv2252/BmrU family lipid kinase
LRKNQDILKFESRNNYFFIINPNAGNEGGKKEWPLISKVLEENQLDYSFAFTDSQGHAEKIVAEKIVEGYKKFVVVGGDGTLNETINGIFKQSLVPQSEIFLGLIQMGTGNDWARYYQLSFDYNDAVKRLLKMETKKQDVGVVKYCDGENQKSAYFINVAGLCFDSTVVKATNVMKERGRRTKAAYLISLLKSLINYKPWTLKLSINDQVLEGKFLSISIGNGKFSGGGMIQTPNAVIDDGLLDVTIYENMPKFKIITNIKKTV